MNKFILRPRISGTKSADQKKKDKNRETGVGRETERINGKIAFGFKLMLKKFFLRCINVRIFAALVFIYEKERINTSFSIQQSR